MVRITALALFVAATAAQAAGIYSYRAEDGSIVFTDEPAKGSKRVQVEQPMTVPAMQTGRQAKPAAAEQPLWPEPSAKTPPAPRDEPVPSYDSSSNTSWNSGTQGITSNTRPKRVEPAEEPVERKRPTVANPYKTLRVVSPVSGSSSWAGNTPVKLKLTPALQAGHVISLRVDGREAAVGTDTQIELPALERGGHSLRAAVLDVESGRQLIVSRKVQFQVHRPHKNQDSRMLHPSVNRDK